MKAIPSLVAFLLILSPLHAQGARQPAGPAAPGAASVYATGGGGYGAAGASGMPSAGNSFAAGLLSEEAEQDLGSAAASYRRTIQAFDRQRTEAANAIFRLGEVYRKMGRIEEAKVQYARILREFPDMVRLTELSHGLLLGEEGRPGMGTGPEARTTASDPETEARTSSDKIIMDLMRERYGLGAGSQGRPDRYGPATVPSMDPALAARYGLPLPSPSSTPTAGRESERMACVSNLRQLGIAARIYAAEKDAVFPPNPALMSNEIAVTKVLVCPSDTARQAAPSWAEFDPANHMTYEYLGAGVRENEPQRTLYHCPIHGHVALVDGSVQYRRTPSPGAVEQAQEVLEQRVERFGAPAPQSDTVPAVVHVPVLVSSNGTIQLEGKPVEVDMLRARLRERAADPGQVTMVMVQAEQDTNFVRVAEVLEACRSAGVTNVTVAADLRPIIHQEIERLTAEADALQDRARDRNTFSKQIQESGRASQMIAEARTGFIAVHQHHDCRQGHPARSAKATALPLARPAHRVAGAGHGRVRFHLLASGPATDSTAQCSARFLDPARG